VATAAKRHIEEREIQSVIALLDGQLERIPRF
jgi:hypothetical protein